MICNWKQQFDIQRFAEGGAAGGAAAAAGSAADAPFLSNVISETGTVMQVDLMHTTLKTIDNRHIVIPNGVVVNS